MIDEAKVQKKFAFCNAGLKNKGTPKNSPFTKLPYDLEK